MAEQLPTVTLGSVVERVTAKNKGLLDRVFTVSAKFGLVDQEKYFNKRVASKNLAGYTVIDPGTYVYNKSYSVAAPLGVVTRNRYDAPGVVSPLYIAFTRASDDLAESFLDLAVHSPTFTKTLRAFVKEGGRAHGGVNVSSKDFFETRIPLPALTDQRRIVDLIGSVDSYIDALRVQADAARITGTSLLHEFLNAGGEDWEMTTIGAVTDSRLGKMLSKAAKSGKHQEFPYLRNANVQWGEIGLSDLNTMEFSLSEQSEFSLGAGDVLVCEGGEVGRSAVVEHDLSGIFFQKALHRIRCGPNLEPWFLHYFLRHAAMTGGFQHFATALTIQHLTGEKLRRVPIDLPPLPRQQEIVELVSSADETAKATERALKSATVFRSSLLSALLSGNHEISESYDALLEAS